jgi:hypothetical protein
MDRSDDPRQPGVPALLETGRSFLAAGRLDEAEIEFRLLLRVEPDNAGGLVGLAEAARLGGDTELAIMHYQAAAAARPDDLGIHAALRHLLIEQARFDWKADIAKALGILQRANSVPEDRLAACNLLAQYGVTQGLEGELEALAHQFQQAADLLRAARQLERSGMARRLPNLERVGDLEQDELILSFGVTERPVPGSDTLVLVFGGANHRLGLSFDIIQRILRPTGVSTLYLRDLERTWYLGGVIGLGSSFGEAVAGLRTTAARFGTRRTVAIGNCVGSAGALRYGLALGVDAILGVAPRLRIPDFTMASPRMRDRLSRLRDSEPLLARDVRELYEAACQQPRLNLIYGEDCMEDAADVLHMAGIAGVTALGIAGYSRHACLSILLGRGLLTPLLHGFVRDGTISSELRAEIQRAAQPRSDSPEERGRG